MLLQLTMKNYMQVTEMDIAVTAITMGTINESILMMIDKAGKKNNFSPAFILFFHR